MHVIFFSLLYVNDLHRTSSSRLLIFVADWFEFSLVPDRDAEWRCGLFAFWRHAAKNVLGNKRFSDNETHHGRILQGTGTFDVLLSIGTFFALLALCEGNHRSPMDSSHRGSTMQTFDDFFAQTRCWKKGHFTWLASRAPIHLMAHSEWSCTTSCTMDLEVSVAAPARSWNGQWFKISEIF